MFQANQELAKNQQKIKNIYLTTIYKGLIHNKSVREIHKELYDLTINKKGYNKNTYQIAVDNLKKIYKKLPSNVIIGEDRSNVDLIAIMVYRLLKETESELAKSFNDERLSSQEQIKNKVLKEALQENRKNGKVFYIASKHNDCALDHLNLQGHIYIDENWQTYVSKEYKPLIQQYIKRNDIMTFQEAISKPYWFITRPHCRHYFNELSIEETLNENVDELSKKYKMTRNIGDRQYLQTMDSKVGTLERKLIGEYRNAQLMVDKYQNRLETLKELYKTHKIDDIKYAIKKTELLINKWKRYMSEVKNAN